MKIDIAVPTGLDPYVAGVVSALEFGRRNLLRTIEGLTPEQLAATAPGFSNSIASLAIHVAGYELVCAHRIAGGEVPAELKPDFLLNGPQNPIPVATGETAESLKAKLDQSRSYLLERLAKVTQADLDREITLGPERTATIRWVLALIPYHMSEHYGQMALLKKLVTQA